MSSRAKTIAPVVAAILIALTPAHASAAALGSRTLRAGAHGGDVHDLQQLLDRAGCHLQQDGSYGPATYHCVRWWQSLAALPITGVMNNRMVLDLRSWLHNAATGGAAAVQPTPVTTTTATPTTPVANATIGTNGLAVAPTSAPAAIVAMIAAGNQIATTPYLWGGGHQSWSSPGGYDCSGSVSYVLHAAGLLNSPLVSGQFSTWGSVGDGTWVTIYSNSTHVWMTIAGLRFDTGGLDDKPASRWQSTTLPSTGYAVTHPSGL